MDADQAEEAVPLLQDLPGEVEGADLPAPVAEDDREDLGVGEGVGAGSEEALPGAFVRGEVPALGGRRGGRRRG
jgi:hypothetical protein